MTPVRLSRASASQWGIDLGPRRSKYGAVKSGGFDSKREAARYRDLRLLEMAGEIEDVRRQPEFHVWVHGVLVCRYVADFMFTRCGSLAIEDCKGFKTPTYRLKKKLVEAVFGIEVHES